LATVPQRETISAQEKVDWNDIEPSLAEIRKDGYALRDSTLTRGLRILAVPVLDPDGHAIGAISIAAPAARITADEFRLLALEPAQKTARAVARSLEAGGSVGVDL
jgi:IclR family pca regulon transcriptional regulator